MEYKELVQKKLKDNEILKSLEQANEKGEAYSFSEEQIVESQQQKGKKQINDLYYNSIFPAINGIVYLVNYSLSLICLPVLYLDNTKKGAIYVAIFSWISLLVIWVIMKVVDKKIKLKMKKERRWIDYLNQFSIETSVFSYTISSIGYMLVFIENIVFWFFYISMLVTFILAIYYIIIVPAKKSKGKIKLEAGEK